jgi:hypothetical protein
MRAAAEDLRVRQRLAERLDRAGVEHHVRVAVRLVQVLVLELRRRGQQHVGVVGGVGLEVLEDDGEEILAAQAGDDVLAIGGDGAGVGVVDDERLHRRIVGARQRLAEAGHVDRAGAGRAEVFARERRGVEF